MSSILVKENYIKENKTYLFMTCKQVEVTSKQISKINSWTKGLVKCPLSIQVIHNMINMTNNNFPFKYSVFFQYIFFKYMFFLQLQCNCFMTPETHVVFKKNFTSAANFRGFCVCANTFFHIANMDLVVCKIQTSQLHDISDIIYRNHFQEVRTLILVSREQSPPVRFKV